MARARGRTGEQAQEARTDWLQAARVCGVLGGLASLGLVAYLIGEAGLPPVRGLFRGTAPEAIQMLWTVLLLGLFALGSAAALAVPRWPQAGGLMVLWGSLGWVALLLGYISTQSTPTILGAVFPASTFTVTPLVVGGLIALLAATSAEAEGEEARRGPPAQGGSHG